MFTFFLFPDLLLRILRRNLPRAKINYSPFLLCSKLFMFSHFGNNIACSIFVSVNIFFVVQTALLVYFFAVFPCCSKLLFCHDCHKNCVQ